MMGMTRVSASSSAASTDGSLLRRALCVVPVHEIEGKWGRVSAVVKAESVQAREERKEVKHGTAVVDVHLLLRQHLAVLDQSSKGCSGVSALLAVHERVWGEC